MRTKCHDMYCLDPDCANYYILGSAPRGRRHNINKVRSNLGIISGNMTRFCQFRKRNAASRIISASRLSETTGTSWCPPNGSHQFNAAGVSTHSNNGYIKVRLVSLYLIRFRTPSDDLEGSMSIHHHTSPTHHGVHPVACRLFSSSPYWRLCVP